MEILAMLDFPYVIFGQPPVVAQPSEHALHHPPFGQHLESAFFLAADIHPLLQGPFRIPLGIALIGGIGAKSLQVPGHLSETASNTYKPAAVSWT